MIIRIELNPRLLAGRDMDFRNIYCLTESFLLPVPPLYYDLSSDIPLIEIQNLKYRSSQSRILSPVPVLLLK